MDMCLYIQFAFRESIETSVGFTDLFAKNKMKRKTGETVHAAINSSMLFIKAIAHKRVTMT